MIKKALAASVPALLSGAGTTAGFDAANMIETMVTGAQTQLYSVIGIVAPVLGSIAVAITLVKFGLKWIRHLAAG